MIRLQYILPLLYLIISYSSCYGNNLIDSSPTSRSTNDVSKAEIHTIPTKPHSIFDIVKDLDLQGRTYKIPEDVTIRHRGGIIKNGTLIGNKTKIISKKPIFDRITIQGSWAVENISTSLFANLQYNNSLRDVLALANASINNQVTIERGDYLIALDSKNRCGITIPSNTRLCIEGNIILAPNKYDYYEILNVQGNNITIFGQGCIIGDKEKHTGTKGEWGMGLFIRGKDITVRNITIKDCWGDCIYVGKKSHNVHIEKCILDNGRRQGISVTSAHYVYIYDCIIKNVRGTAPQRAIDIEPNKGDTVQNVFIHNILIQNCFGGIMAYGAAQGAYISDIYIDDCIVDEKVQTSSYSFSYANKVSLKNCTANNGDRKIGFNRVNIVETKKNKVNGRFNMETYKSCKIVNGKKQ